MTITFVNIGTVSTSADTATPFANTSPALPASVAAGDLLLIAQGHKPTTTTPSISGYSLTATIADGTGETTGADNGNVRARAYSRTMVAGDVAPSFTWPAQYNPHQSVMLGLRKTEVGSWTVEAATGADSNATTTTLAATGSATLTFAPGDWVICIMVLATDINPPTGVSLTVPGCTLGTVTQRMAVPGTTQGFDQALFVYTAEIASGSASGAPQYSATATAGVAGPPPTGSSHGAFIFLRIVEPAPSSGATVTPATVVGTAGVGNPIISTPSAAAVFRLRTGTSGSRLRSVSQLRLGASSAVWATILPATVAATAYANMPGLWGPPLTVIATPISASQINLSWSAVPTATKYDVERDGVVIAWDVIGTSYSDTGLATATSYSYRVRSVRPA